MVLEAVEREEKVMEKKTTKQIVLVVVNWVFFIFAIISSFAQLYLAFKITPTFKELLRGFKVDLNPLTLFVFSPYYKLFVILLISFLIWKEIRFKENKKMLLIINISYVVIFYLLIGLVVVGCFLPIFEIANTK